MVFGPRVGDDRLQPAAPRGGLAGVGVVDEPAFAVPQGPRGVPTGQSEDDGDLRRGDPLAAQLVPDLVAVHLILGADQLYVLQECIARFVSASMVCLHARVHSVDYFCPWVATGVQS